jgi:hypothetical protein
MQKPPPLPAEVLAKVLRISGIDGFTLVFIAGGFGLISAAYADGLGALVGGLAAGAGLIELHGRRRLKAGDGRGVNGLVRSQLVLLATILFYVAFQLYRFDPQSMLAVMDAAEAMVQRWFGLEVVPLSDAFGLTAKRFSELAKTTVRTAYLAVGLVSILCQGGLALYYHRREQVIAKALHKI